MTASEWLTSTDTQKMLAFLRGSGKASDRKLRLAGCACVRHGVWPLLADERYRKAVVARERHEDGLASPAELQAAQEGAWHALVEACGGGSPAPDAERAAAEVAGQPYPSGMQRAAASGNVWEWLQDGEARWADETERWAERVLEFAARAAQAAEGVTTEGSVAAQCGLLRCVFGNPFRPLPAVAPSVLDWEGGTVVCLARAAYEERLLPSGHLDTARLAVLCDALEDTGCADAVLLGHLRGPGPHVRGCFALDLLLGKE